MGSAVRWTYMAVTNGIRHCDHNTGGHKKWELEKPNKNWRNPRKKKLLTEIEPLQLAF